VLKKNIKGITSVINRFGIRSCLFNYFSILTSDVCVVSFQKSGRTWLRLMLAKILALEYHLRPIKIETQMMTLFIPFIPNVYFSHVGCTAPAGKEKCFKKVISNRKVTLDFRKLLRKKRLVFLTRDPRDIVVSLFHDHTKRNMWYEGNDISEFIRDPKWGISKIINFMNLWGEEIEKRFDFVLILRYEDLQKNTIKEFKKFLDFLMIDPSDNDIRKAVKYACFDNVRKMELEGTFKDERMRPKDIKDHNSYRARKGKVGSHKEELCDEDICYLDKKIKEELNPLFGY